MTLAGWDLQSAIEAVCSPRTRPLKYWAIIGRNRIAVLH